MSRNYDNWERLVAAVLDREHLRQLALYHSRDPSTTSDQDDESSSFRSSFSSTSSIYDNQRVVQRLVLPTPLNHSDLMRSFTDWKALLPPGRQQVVWPSASLSFSLDKRTGKNCFMIGSRALRISENYKLVDHHDSRFLEVAQGYPFPGPDYIEGHIEVERLSPDTVYEVYLVFRFASLDDADKKDPIPRFDMHTCGEPRDHESADDESNWKNPLWPYELHEDLRVREYAGLDEYGRIDLGKLYKPNPGTITAIIRLVDCEYFLSRDSYEITAEARTDGWMEVEIGEIYIDHQRWGGNVEAWLLNAKRYWLKTQSFGHPIVEGIEFRPLGTGGMPPSNRRRMSEWRRHGKSLPIAGAPTSSLGSLQLHMPVDWYPTSGR